MLYRPFYLLSLQQITHSLVLLLVLHPKTASYEFDDQVLFYNTLVHFLNSK